MAMDTERCVVAGPTPAVALFRSLGAGTRLRIVARFSGGEARVVDLTGGLAVAERVLAAVAPCPTCGTGTPAATG